MLQTDYRQAKTQLLEKRKNTRRKERVESAGGTFTDTEFKRLCNFYGNRCLACGSTESLTPDHVIPLNQGGKNDITNIQPLCYRCNSGKKDQIVDYRPVGTNPPGVLPEGWQSWPTQAKREFLAKLRQIQVIPGLNDTPLGAKSDSVTWIERNFHIPELSGPIKLHPYQKAVLREAHRLNEDGKFVYNLVLWSDIKKSAKSSIAAAVALYRAFQTQWGSIKIIANDLKQADSRVAFYLRRAIQLNPEMKNIRQVLYKTVLPNHTTIEAIPIDPGGEAGGNDDLIIFSELWAAKHKAIQQMWSEMTLSPTKFGYSQRWIETYAGYSGESPLLEQLYQQGVTDGERLDLSYTDEAEYHDLSDLEVYSNGGMLCLWNTQPRLAWQTEEYYNSESQILVPDEFSRIHRNQWISSTGKFVPDEWWDTCKGELPGFTKQDPMILAADAGVSGDCFGLVGVTNRGDSSLVRFAQKWVPPKNGKIDFLGTVDDPGPERVIARLCFFHNVIEVRYDPYQLHDMATRLKTGIYVDRDGNIVDKSQSIKKIRVNMVEFNQAGDRLKADKQLYDKIKDRRIVHNGNPDLTEHIKNANAKKDTTSGGTDEGRKLRIVKRSPSLKIDLAVSLSMASYTEGEVKKSVFAW